MRSILSTAVIAACLGAGAVAQDDATRARRIAPAPPQQQKSQEDYAKLRKEKLAKPVFELAPWVSDYDQAREAAKKEGKLIFAYFTRSYAP